jgi:hypothetical protein
VTTFVLVLTSCTSRDFSETDIITENISFSNQSLIFSNSSFTKNEIITYYLKDQPNVLLVDIRDFFELVSPLFAEAYFEKNNDSITFNFDTTIIEFDFAQNTIASNNSGFNYSIASALSIKDSAQTIDKSS